MPKQEKPNALKIRDMIADMEITPENAPIKLREYAAIRRKQAPVRGQKEARQIEAFAAVVEGMTVEKKAEALDRIQRILDDVMELWTWFKPHWEALGQAWLDQEAV